MRLAEVQRRVREVLSMQAEALHPDSSVEKAAAALSACRVLYYHTLRTLLDHDISDDARQLIEAALEAER